MKRPLAYLNCGAVNPRNGKECMIPCTSHTKHADEHGERWTAPPGPNAKPAPNAKPEGCP
jgi:hypothetical protein